MISRFLTILTLFCFSCNEKKLFIQLDSSQTNILFNNLISENDSMNILDYEYLYNGGGVAISDFNDDGLEDIFFSGNMVSNKLYLNKGSWSFDDVSIESGIEAKNRWSSGINVLDINLDGKLDIYISASTLHLDSLRANMLFINKGNNKDGIPYFIDEAKAYGIDDMSHNINSSFFDYDNDGDLDVYLLINKMDKDKQPNQYRKKVVDGSSSKNDKLFRNDYSDELGHPFFTDVTKEAGILIEGFGLGISISDINKDGWKDIFVSNDYLTNDLLWLNNKDGTFSDKASEYFKHTSYSSMGNNIIDFNNDGNNEIIELDMMPEDNLRRKTMLTENNYNTYLNNDRYNYGYQYVRNTLQQNQGFFNGVPVYSEISMLSGISATDWSWAPIAGDYDNDGFKDLIITNGFPKDITDRDFIDYQTEMASFADKKTLLSIIPEVKLKNYAFRNISSSQGVVMFEDVTDSWGIDEPSFSNGAAHGDLDNDGDLDYVVNNINGTSHVYKNESTKIYDFNWINIKLTGPLKNPDAIGSLITIYLSDSSFQTYEYNPFRGYLSSMENSAHFGLGNSSIDSLMITWPDNSISSIEKIEINKKIKFDYKSLTNRNSQLPKNSKFLFDSFYLGSDILHEEFEFIDFNIQPLLFHKLSQFGPGISVGDFNGDDLDDFYIGGSRSYSGKFYQQNSDESFSKMNLFKEEGNYIEEELGTLLFDADNDGDDDLYIVSGGNEYEKSHYSYMDRFFLNDNGKYIKSNNIIPTFLNSGSCVRANDYDNDGDLDLFICGRVVPHDYPFPATSYLLENKLDQGKLKFEIVNSSTAPNLNNLGLVTDALWTDVDNDGFTDLIVVGEFMPITIFKNKVTKFEKLISTGLENYKGFWNSIAGSDLDLDGDIDYVVGNIGNNNLLNIKEDKNIYLVVGDFDKNGSTDFFPSAYFKDKNEKLQLYPFFTRHDFQKEVIDVRANYILNSDFGSATFDDLINKITLGDSTFKLSINTLESSYIENTGNGKFILRALPKEAQLSKVHGIYLDDFNSDSFTDILIIGNDYGGEVGMGRYDASNGVVLLGNSDGDYIPQKIQKSGIYVPGDAKSLVRLIVGNKSIVLAGQNSDDLIAFQNNNFIDKSIKISSNEKYAIIYLHDGNTYKKEFYYGSSFLSQSSRVLVFNEFIKKAEIFSFNGGSRNIIN
mgnify:FL=1|tara:strand:+ start:3101 stop:6628 length:3528 start_codon:yes stop_codon:yes gene_type:complete